VRQEHPAENRTHVHPSEAICDERDGRRHGGDVVEAEEDREDGQPGELGDER
jgi:hypothetical protein